MTRHLKETKFWDGPILGRFAARLAVSLFALLLFTSPALAFLQIVEPEDGAIVSGDAPVTVEYSYGFIGVRILTNWSHSYLTTSTSGQYTWYFNSLSKPNNSQWILNVSAFSGAESDTVTVTAFNPNPEVTIVAPENGSSVIYDTSVLPVTINCSRVAPNPSGISHLRALLWHSDSAIILREDADFSPDYPGSVEPTLYFDISAYPPGEIHVWAICDDSSGRTSDDEAVVTKQPPSNVSIANLSITKNTGADTFVEGESITYEIVVSNRGPDHASDVVVSDVLPEWIIPQSFECSNGVEGEGWPGTLTFASLHAGESIVCQIEAKVAANIYEEAPRDDDGRVRLSNLASVESSEVDPDLSDNTSELVETEVLFGEFEISKARMVSPTELGIDIKVKYPGGFPAETPRKIEFSATINGTHIQRTFNVTGLVDPGETKEIRYDDGFVPPRVIDLTDPDGDAETHDAVPRFVENEEFYLAGQAFYEGGPYSGEDKKKVTIPLPVVILHGYTYTHMFWGNLLHYFRHAGYDKLEDCLKEHGEYIRGDAQYRTLWGPHDYSYKADKETPTSLMAKVDSWVDDSLTKNYAAKVDLIGHSTGGLVARNYAGLNPKVNKVISIGTPHLGLTKFYEIGFAELSEELAERVLKVPGTDDFNALLWFRPNWFWPNFPDTSSLVLRTWANNEYIEEPLPELYENHPHLFNPTYRASTKYYSLWAVSKKVPVKLVVEARSNGWYRVVDKKMGSGDGLVPVVSASSFRPYGTPVRAEGDIHAVLSKHPQVMRNVLRILTENKGISCDDNGGKSQTGTIAPLAIDSHTVSVNPLTTKADFSLTWPGSDLDLVLNDPSGRRIDAEIASSDPNIDFFDGHTFEQYIVQNPIAGNWDVEIIAVDVPEAGEPYELETYFTQNIKPIADANGPYVGYEGYPTILDGSQSSDLDGDTLSYSWDFDGDAAIDSIAVQPTHIWPDDYQGTVALEISDGEFASFDTAAITIENLPPAIGGVGVPEVPYALGTEVTASATFADPGIFDTHTVVFDWGDTATSSGTVTEVNGEGTALGTHTYTAPGVYEVSVTVTDDDGGQDTYIADAYIVIYDSDGGFVTGGGWIESPEGAYVEDPNLTGKANFGFVSKYKKGASIPTGETEFQFKVADLDFHSTSYEWLVIAGARAQYKGEGTINGLGEYGFMLTAIDGALPGGLGEDKFRIKIWDKTQNDAPVYDNLMDAPDSADLTTTLGGGSIVIHKK